MLVSLTLLSKLLFTKHNAIVYLFREINACLPL